MSGAAMLSGGAALRGGAGLVYLAVPHDLLPIVATANPCYLTAPLPQDAEGRLATAAVSAVRELVRGKNVVAVGPGLGQSAGVAAVVEAVLAEVSVPVVVDADGLNSLQHRTDRLRRRTGPLVLTPHPGEFARLLGTDVATVQGNRVELAVRFALEQNVVLLLKGKDTLVTDGRRLYHNTTGNPGMATGGTGDVLTGLIAALLAQGLSPFEAAQLGACWHGQAGDLARDDLGEVCLIASDLLHYLPGALRAVQSSAQPAGPSASAGGV
jgi:NAD(P)H-hydrate epimerase